MRISSVTGQSRSQNYCIQKNMRTGLLCDSYSVFEKSGNPSFRSGVVWKVLSILAGKVGYEIKKDGKLFKEKQKYYDFLNKPEKYKKELARIINAITNSPIRRDRTARYEALRNDNMPSMEEMKKILLKDIIPRISDYKYSSRNIKKQCLERLFDIGEYNNDTFLKCFESLPDKQYSNFKKSIIEKVLYSVDNKYLSEQQPKMYHNYYNFKLIECLKDGRYASFLKDNLEGIFSLHDRLVSNGKALMKSEHNNAYEEYLHNYFRVNTTIHKFMQEYKEEAFQKAVEISQGNSFILAKDLNIDESIAKSIIEDIKALKLAKQEPSKEEKLKIYKTRLNKKFSEPAIPKNWLQKISFNKDYDKVYSELKDITNFIDKTEFSKELRKVYASKIKSLEKKVNKCEIEFHRRSEVFDLDIVEKMDYTNRV